MYFFQKLQDDAQDWSAKADSKLKTYLLFIIAVSTLEIVTAVTLSRLMPIWPWTKYLSWLIYDASIVTGAYLAFRTANILASYTAGGLVNGMPNFQIGTLLTAIFTKEKWPDFKLKEFLDAGGAFTAVLVMYIAYVPIGLGIITILTTIFVAWNPWAITVVVGGLLMVAFVEIIRKGKAVFFIRFAYLVALLQVGIGGYDMFHRPTYVEKVKGQAAENTWQADEGLVQPVYESLKKGKRPSEQAIATVDNIEAARDAQTPVSQAVKLFSGTQIQVTIKDLEPVTVYGIPDGRRTFTIEGKDPIIFIMMPDKTSPTGMSAVKNSLRDPSFTLVTEDGATDGGTVIVRNGRIALRLRVPPDTEQNIRSGMIRIAESTVTVKFK